MIAQSMQKTAVPSAEELQRLSDVEGREWIGASPDDQAALAYLAKLSPLDYDRLRKNEAERLGVRADTLDKEVARLRGGTHAEGAGAGNVILHDPEPWPHPVDGSRLLDFLVQTISAHIVLPAGAAEAMALWILHAHAHEASAISPILAITSPTPECGKTTTLMALAALVPRPLPASNITSAALFRAVEKWRPTLLIDEADTFLKDSDELRGVLNSGHARSSAWVIRTTGDDHEPRRFATWSPKAVALIGKLPPTLESRSIHVELRRMGAGEHVQALRGERIAYLTVLCRLAWRWGRDHLDLLRAAEPEMHQSLRGRTADNWRSLLAIADTAGGTWGARARQAAEALVAGRSEQTAGVLLLEDIRALFADQASDRLTSSEIVEALGRLENRPWPEWKSDKPITVRQLARLLEPFAVAPTTIWAAGRAVKGYHLDSFADAFIRYLPPPPISSVSPLGVAELRRSEDFPSVRSGSGPNGLQRASNPQNSANPNGLTDETTEGGAETCEQDGLEAVEL